MIKSKILDCPLGPLSECQPRITNIDNSALVTLLFPFKIKLMNDTQYTNASRELNVWINQSEERNDSRVLEWKIVNSTSSIV